MPTKWSSGFPYLPHIHATIQPVEAKAGGETLLSKIPAWAIAVAVMALVGLRLWASANVIGAGTIAYALDDAYIHLAIAKNFAFHGVWGVTPYENVSASSSPGWIFLVALLMKALGNQVWIPLLLNVFAAVGLAYALDRLLKAYVSPTLWRAAVLLALLGFVPVFSYVAIGMEHTLQLMLVAVYFGFARRICNPNFKFDAKQAALLAALAASMVLVRIECAVLFPIPFIYALIKKDIKCAGAMAAGPLAAFGGFAALMVSKGMPIEPNSMAVKRMKLPESDRLAYVASMAWQNLVSHWELTALFAGLLSLLVLLIAEKGRGTSKLLVATPILGFVIHSMNGTFGAFHRYDGYLMVFSFLAIVAVLSEQLKPGAPLTGRSGAALLCAAVALCLMPNRGWTVTRDTPVAMANIGHQQLQMARFLAKFYPNGRVMVNDIGAVCYYGDPHLLDSGGLATTSVAHAFLRGEFTEEFLEDEMRRRDIEVCAVYTNWLRGKPGPILIPVGDWTVTDKMVVGAGATVTFFGTTPERAATLIARLRAYDPELPREVQRRYRRAETLPKGP